MSKHQEAYIFLDMDGTMNSHRSLIAYGSYKAESIDPVCVALLNVLCEMLERARYTPYVVICSDWRLAHPQLVFWHKLFAKGTSIVVHGVTPNGGMATRGDECYHYLKDRGDVEAPWIVLDDNSIGAHDEHRIQVNPNVGLTHETIDDAFYRITNESLLPDGLAVLGKWQAVKAWDKRRHRQPVVGSA